MVSDRTEEEQVEALKAWWDENGTSLIIGIVVVLAGVFGFRTWESNKMAAADAASSLYEDLAQAVEVGTFDTLSEERKSTAQFVANQLKTEYPESTYAHFAAMHLAKIAVEDGELETAEEELNWALSHDVNDELGVIVNERLARVKYAKETYGEALAQLDSVEPGAHKSSYEELRGDIYFAMGEMDQAREAYQRALDALENPDTRPFLKMKLQDLVAPATEIAISGEEVTEQGDSSEG